MRSYAITASILAVALFGVANSPSALAQTKNEQKQAQPIVVEVQPGDYLAKIADNHQTNYRRLYDANLEIKHPDLIYPGTKVRVPNPDEQLAQRSLPEEVPATAPVKQQSQPKAAAPVRVPAAKKAAPSIVSGSVWDQLARCEAGGDWAINTGNGYYGGLQFTLSSWRAAGGSGYPHQASREEQIARGQTLQSMQGWGAWPACSSKLGLR